ncbi:MAG: ketopantoate reductase C-terminal domain-containing protein [Actinomycetota bacterium]
MGSSMGYDREAGRPLEFDALTGAIVRAGQRHGIPTPGNQLVLALLATLDDHLRAGAMERGPTAGNSL